MLKHKLVDFIIQFMEEVDKEISEMKLFVSIPFSDDVIYKNANFIIAECPGKIRCRVVLNTGKHRFIFLHSLHNPRLTPTP